MTSAAPQAPPTIVVLGAGVGGLTAAYRLSALRDRAARAPVLHVVEASPRVGGGIETVARDGFTVERGPDMMITEKPWGLELCSELGLADAVIPTNPAFRTSFIVRGRALYPVPEGFHLMAPSRLLPFARSSLLSWKGKLRVALEPFVPARRSDDDETLADFVRRRLGDEALARVAQPMIGGIYTADPERLSLRATMPRFLDMERTHGSVVRALVAARRRADAGGDPAATAGARGPRYELFFSLREGMEQLPRALAVRIARSATMQLRSSVRALVRRERGWRVDTDRGSIDADAVCIALPSYTAASLLESVLADAAEELHAIEHSSTATVAFAFRREDIAHPLDGFGFVVPAIEKRSTLACTFSSVKFPGRAPEGMVLLRGFVGGALSPQSFALDDEAMTAAVLADVRDLLGVRGAPLWSMLTRYPRSMPQYHMGHLERVARIETAMRAEPTLALVGGAYRGAGIPDTIRSANEAAARIGAALGLRTPEP